MRTLFLALPLVAAAWTPAAAASAGDKAPELVPSEWLNHRGAVSWDTLKGRVILVEKWATW